MLLDLFADAALPGDLTLVRFARSAMATTFEVALPFGTSLAQPAADDALDLIDSLEDRLTVYRSHSEVCGINDRAATEAVEVEADLFDLLAACVRWTNSTGGAFDIFTGALTKAWGFYRRQGRRPSPREQAEALARTGTRNVALDPVGRTIRFARAGVEINLGAVGKGYALDRAADYCADGGACYRRCCTAVRAASAPSDRRRATRTAGRCP